MNRIMELLTERERDRTWLARKMGISRQALTYKIEHDTFTATQKFDAAYFLGISVDEAFPVAVSVAADLR